MISQGLEAPIDKPFVATESDIDIFSCQDDQDNFDLLLQHPKAVDDFPANGQNSLNFEDFHLAPPRLTGSNRGSMFSSSSSSICSKSLKYDDDSFVSYGNQSETSRNSDTRKYRSGSMFSSSSSSICSKSVTYDDDSFVSYGNQSETSSRNSDTKKHRKRFYSRIKPKKTVTFHPQLDVRTIPRLNNLPEEELTRRWYQNCELAHIKSQVIEQIRMAKNKELPAENDENTLRGLRMPKKQQRRSLAIMALSGVLDEQKRQARDQVSDPETLAKLYSSFAFTAKQMALDMARLDAKAVQEDNDEK